MQFQKSSLLDRADILKFTLKLYAETSWKRIAAASEEAHETLHYWRQSEKCTTGVSLFDQFTQLMVEEPIPWPGFEGSAVNRMSLSRYYMCAAYLPIVWAVRLLKDKDTADELRFVAIMYLEFAEQVIETGKAIAWTDKDKFVQTCCDCICTR